MYVAEYLKQAGDSEAFEELQPEALALKLRSFYGSLRTKSGAMYSKSGYINIRASINCHLSAPPFNRKFNIMRDREFLIANNVFTGILRTLRQQGMDITKHKSPILPGDMQELYQSGTLSNSTPLALQRKVFIELSIQFGRRGQEGLRELRHDSVVIKFDDKGNK